VYTRPYIMGGHNMGGHKTTPLRTFGAFRSSLGEGRYFF
jgi:hypothetical protein